MTSARCAHCPAELRGGARFCARCGAPRTDLDTDGPGPVVPPPVVGDRRPHRTVLVAALAGALVVAVAATGWALTRPGPDPAEAGTAQEATTGPPTDTPAPTTTAPPADPLAVLDARATADDATATALAGRWLPQVGAKRPGTNITGYADVVRELDRIEAAHPDTRFLLVRSEDWSSFRFGGYWVTLAAEGYSGPADANGWCDSRGFPVDDCYAKRLSRTEGPEGNSVPR